MVARARSFLAYGTLSGEARYKELAEEAMRNCLCLFRPDGSASCAYMYPYTCNGRKGAFYDAFANDQDFALYFAMVSEMFGKKTFIIKKENENAPPKATRFWRCIFYGEERSNQRVSRFFRYWSGVCPICFLKSRIK